MFWICPCVLIALFQIQLPTGAMLFQRPSWNRLLNPFSKLESNVCPDNFSDGGCENCDSCFYLELHTSSDGKTFEEGEVSLTNNL